MYAIYRMYYKLLFKQLRGESVGKMYFGKHGETTVWIEGIIIQLFL
jgi:hypothetical protein